MSLARLSDVLFWAAFALYLGGTALYFLALRSPDARSRAGTALVGAGAVAHLGMIVSRAMAARRVPWGNMYEYSTVLVFLLVAFYLLVVHRKPSLRAAGAFTMLIAVATMGLARGLYAPAGPLIPALNSWWLKVHVISAITASSLFSIGFVFTVLFLLKERAERRAQAPAFGGSTVGAAYAGTIDERPAGGFPTDHVEEDPDAGDRPPVGGGLIGRLPASTTLDTWAYRFHAVAFPVWTWAVIAGAIWAAKAWGRYWGWDPKEIWAFITWVVYAGYLHARATAGWRGRRAAVVAITGFASLWITYYVVNLFIAGLHSYSGLE